MTEQVAERVALRTLPGWRRAQPPRIPSRLLLRFFDNYLHFFVKRHFHALRLAGSENWRGIRGPIIICLNHPSWWDPLTALLVSRFLRRDAEHYAPIDALAVERYRILLQLGMFPVEQGTLRGAAQFLQASEWILRRRDAVLWVTPQGTFCDVRVRPVAFQGGLDALLRRVPDATVLPLALEYTFWNERLPEALAMLGRPLRFLGGELQGALHGENQKPGEQVAAALEQTQNALAEAAIARSSQLFISLLAGGAGTSGIYGTWQRLSALVRGEKFESDHGNLSRRTRRNA